MRTIRDNAGTVAAVATTPGSRVRLDWVDGGRGIAICLVALYHSANWLLAAGAPVAGWVELNLVVSSLRMPLFFALSGLFAAKWLRVSWGELWRGKVRLFAWVFIVWSAIGAVLFSAATRVLKGEGSLVQGTLLPILLAPFRPRLELWFIWALALFFCLAKLSRRLDPRLQLVVAGLASAVALSGWETVSPGWNGSVRYYFFFLVGLYGRAFVLRLGETRSALLLGSGFTAWLAVSLVLWHWGWREVPGLYFVNCALGLVGGVAISRAVRWSLLRRIGRQTLPIYLTHTPVILTVCMALAAVGLTRVGTPLVVLPPFLMVFAVATSLWLSRVLPRLRLGWLYETPRWVPGGRTTTPAATPAVAERVAG